MIWDAKVSTIYLKFYFIFVKPLWFYVELHKQSLQYPCNLSCWQRKWVEKKKMMKIIKEWGHGYRSWLSREEAWKGESSSMVVQMVKRWDNDASAFSDFWVHSHLFTSADHSPGHSSPSLPYFFLLFFFFCFRYKYNILSHF